MSDSKPFLCGHAGCEKTFTNEDHLSVHKNKHGLKLPHFDLASTDSSLALPFTDQTPTPTKFFRIEEGHLFEEISAGGSPAAANPFEDQFRKAASSIAKSNSEAAAAAAADSPSNHESENGVNGRTKEAVVGDESSLKTFERQSHSETKVPRLRFNLKVRGRDEETLASSKRSPTSGGKKIFLQGPKNELIEATVRRGDDVSDATPVEVCGRRGTDDGAEKQNASESPVEDSPGLDPFSDIEEENEEDEATKRESLLARNRAAACRARRKKKVFISELERNCGDLAVANETLRSQVDTLRKELASTKELLKEHVAAGCDVALNQVLHGRLPSDVASHRFVLVKDDDEDRVGHATPVTLFICP